MQTEALQRVTAWGLGGDPWNYYGGPVPMMEMATADGPANGGPATHAVERPDCRAGADSRTFSGTNTQEVGVDEGDIVETDGTHVFVASQDGVRIVDVAERRGRRRSSTFPRARINCCSTALACWSPRSRTPASTRSCRCTTSRSRGVRRCCAAVISKVA